MTLSASDKKALRKSALRYWVAAALCGLLAAVYEHFSHGVYSMYMVLLFAWPLLGSLAPLLCTVAAARRPAPLSRDLWGCGVATLTVGSCLRGVFDIYGTVVPIACVFWYVGAALLLAAAFAALMDA